MFDSIAEAVFHHGAEHPERLAAADVKNAYTYGELCGRIRNITDWMRSVSVGKGDRILVECTQDTSFLMMAMACQLTGAVFVPFEKNASQESVKRIYEETSAILIASMADHSDTGRYYSLNDIMAHTCEKAPFPDKWGRGDDTAEILFTTGTTGEPKGIIISNRANTAIAENIRQALKMIPQTIELIPLPLSHSHGLRTCYANLYNGSASVIIDGIMNVPLFFKMIEKYNVNAIDISPTLAKLLLKIAGKGLVEYADRIDYIELGTAALGEDIKEQLRNIFTQSRLYNFYGSTEAGRICSLDFSAFDEADCIGYPSVNAVFYIVDDNRNVIASSKDNPGLIAVSGQMVMDGYLNSEELTKSTLSDGILYTNDIGYTDGEGRLYIKGRKGFVINYKGIKISPEEIENAALGFEAVADCACVPVEDKICGQVPKLIVQPVDEKSFDKQELMKYLRNHLEANRLPVYIDFIGKIPRSPTGKLLRKELINHD